MKTRLMAVALGLLVALAVIQPVGVTLAKEPPAATYLALGDSLAVGVGATPLPERERFGYVGLINRHFKKQSHEGPHRLINLAKSGETSPTFIIDGQLGAAVAAIENSNTDVQLVTLDIGANDLLGLLRSEPCASDPGGLNCKLAVARTLTVFAGDYPVILQSLTAALAADPGEESILVMAYYNPFDGITSPFETPVDLALLGSDGEIDCAAFSELDRVADVGLNDLIACIGSFFGVMTVDVHPLFDGKAPELTHITTGDIHPNNDGYAVIAEAFIEVYSGD